MKIACITTSVIPSKTANSIQAMKVCHTLNELAQEIHLWIPRYERSDWQTLAEVYGLRSPFSITWLPFLPFLKQYDFAWQAVGNACRWNADVIYTWSLQAAFFALIKRKTVVMEFHDFPMGKFGPRLFQKFMDLPGGKIVLCTTQALAHGLEERYGIAFSEENLQIAPNGVDLERYANLPLPVDARRELDLKNGVTIGYSGHFYNGRGVDLLLELAKALPKINFIWMGGRTSDIAPWQQRLKQTAVRNVTITGFIPNSRLPLYQAACDILLMPYSRTIAGSSGGNIARVINPMKMFDYLACGRAIIASDLPVFHEVLSEKNALFCQPEDPQDWIKHTQMLLKDEALRMGLARQAKQDAVKYSWNHRTQITLDKLQRILQ